MGPPLFFGKCTGEPVACKGRGAGRAPRNGGGLGPPLFFFTLPNLGMILPRLNLVYLGQDQIANIICLASLWRRTTSCFWPYRLAMHAFILI